MGFVQQDPVARQRFCRDLGGVAVPLRLAASDGTVLSFLSTVTTFGTALDLTAAELSIEAFLPADAATAAALGSPSDDRRNEGTR